MRHITRIKKKINKLLAKVERVPQKALPDFFNHDCKNNETR
nr:MAG TPA: hypothetical protein [Crassvirales sp.]DAY65199.1 MAG TPA: hypothetical protein [Caudoviricetes sp.]